MNGRKIDKFFKPVFDSLYKMSHVGKTLIDDTCFGSFFEFLLSRDIKWIAASTESLGIFWRTDSDLMSPIITSLICDDHEESILSFDLTNAVISYPFFAKFLHSEDPI